MPNERKSHMQKVFLGEYNISLYESIGNCLAFHEALAELLDWVDFETVLNVMRRFNACAVNPQNLGKWQSSIVLFMATKGQYGYLPIHLMPDEPMLTYCLSKHADKKVAMRVCRIMIDHPDMSRRLTWNMVENAIETGNEGLLATLAATVETMRKQRLSNRK